MNITVSWDNKQKTVIRYDFEGRWTWEEFYSASSQAFAMTCTVKHRVDTISNFKHGSVLPPNALIQFRQVMLNAPKNRGINVIVAHNSFVATLVKIFSNLNKRLGERLAVVDSLDEARMLLADRRQ
jgi:hypothetical protein